MKTYENDEDFNNLFFSNVSEELVLQFFFKKGGLLNCTNLTYLWIEKEKSSIGSLILSLAAKGLIKPINSHEYKLTFKARWEALINNKTFKFILVILGLVVAILALK